MFAESAFMHCTTTVLSLCDVFYLSVMLLYNFSILNVLILELFQALKFTLSDYSFDLLYSRILYVRLKAWDSEFLSLEKVRLVFGVLSPSIILLEQIFFLMLYYHFGLYYELVIC